MHFSTASLAVAMGFSATALASPLNMRQQPVRMVFTATTDLSGEGSRFDVSGMTNTCVTIAPAKQNLFVSIQTQEDLQCVFFDNSDCTGTQELTFIPANERDQDFFQNLTVLKAKANAWICSYLGADGNPTSVQASSPISTSYTPLAYSSAPAAAYTTAAPPPSAPAASSSSASIVPVFDATDDSNGGGNRFNVTGPLNQCVNIAVPKQNRFISIQVADNLQCTFFQNDNCQGSADVEIKPVANHGKDIFNNFGSLSGQSNSWICQPLSSAATQITPLFVAATHQALGGMTKQVSNVVDQCFNFPPAFSNDIESVAVDAGFMCAFFSQVNCAGDMEVWTPPPAGSTFTNLGSLSNRSVSWKCLPLPA